MNKSLFFIFLLSINTFIFSGFLIIDKDGMNAIDKCPLPNFDQIVYEYKDNKYKLLWNIPSEKLCENIIKNSANYGILKLQTLEFVIRFYNGRFKKLSDKLNNLNK